MHTHWSPHIDYHISPATPRFFRVQSFLKLETSDIVDYVTMESFMQDNQKARLIRSHSLESCLTFDTASVYATPYNMDSTDHTTYAPYYVESPSTILNLSSVDFRDDGDRKQSEHLPEPSSACSPLSRTASFLSNYSSEPLSMMNVNARLQSWRKSKPSLSHAEVTSKWETVDEEAALGSAGDGRFWEKSERSRCRDCFKSFILWLCMTVFFTAFLLAISTFMYWLICHPQAPSTTLKVRISSLMDYYVTRLHHFRIIPRAQALSGNLKISNRNKRSFMEHNCVHWVSGGNYYD